MYYSIIYEIIQENITLIFIKHYACFWLWRKIPLSFQKNPNSALLHFAKPDTWLKSTLHADSSQAPLIFWIFHTLFAISSQGKTFSPARTLILDFSERLLLFKPKHAAVVSGRFIRQLSQKVNYNRQRRHERQHICSRLCKLNSYRTTNCHKYI